MHFIVGYKNKMNVHAIHILSMILKWWYQKDI